MVKFLVTAWAFEKDYLDLEFEFEPTWNQLKVWFSSRHSAVSRWGKSFFYSSLALPIDLPIEQRSIESCKTM